MEITLIGGALGATGGAEVTSLADRFASGLAEAYLQAGNDLASIQTAVNDPHTASDPDKLFKVQREHEEYVKRMTLTAALASHVGKTADTLLKS